MLEKNSEFIINENNPFENDCLGREVQIRNLSLILKDNKQPLVISIEAPWGYGKTTFIKMWKKHLENNGFNALLFNAWENDYVEDPLIAFIGEFNDWVKNLKGTDKKAKFPQKIEKLTKGLTKAALPLLINIATRGLIDQSDLAKIITDSSKEIANKLEEIAEDRIEAYEKEKQGITEFRKNLSEIVKELSNYQESPKPLIFFIDELDRCRPDYAVKLLERIKHLFSVEGVIFILSIDRGQLEESIRAIYGEGMNCDGYIRRFIDYRFMLPTPNRKQFCSMLFKKFNLPSYQQLHDSNIQFFYEISDIFQFSLRVIEQCFSEISLAIHLLSTQKFIFSGDMLYFIIALKAHNSRFYNELKNRNNEYVVHELLEQITSKKGIDLYLKQSEYLEAVLLIYYFRNNANEIKDFLFRTWESRSEFRKKRTLDEFFTKVLEMINSTIGNNFYSNSLYTIFITLEISELFAIE